MSYVLYNPASVSGDEVIAVSLDDLKLNDKPLIGDLNFIIDELEFPYQVFGNSLFLNTVLEPGIKKRIAFETESETVTKPVKQKTQAEISIKKGGQFVDRVYQGGLFENVDKLIVPPEHTDHSFYIRYEGPGWESDLVGYRLYLDWRNAIDIFGKKTPEMVLHNIGQDGFDSYHEPANWGMDILKVGKSLGIGSIASWTGEKAQRVSETSQITCEITSNGPLFSSIRIIYSDWVINNNQYNLESVISIKAGSRMSSMNLNIDPIPENLCTGIVKHPEGKRLKPDTTPRSWTFLATFGKQSLSDDMLGMAIIYRQDKLISIEEDDHSHVVVLDPSDGSVDYFFLAAWEQEPGGIKNEQEFIDYLNLEIERLENPVEIKIINK
jgi:hypothetical protein